MLAQAAVDTKDNEGTAILAILDRLTIKGALVTIDAIATNPAMAKAMTHKGATTSSPSSATSRRCTMRSPPTLPILSRQSWPASRTSTRACPRKGGDHGRIETRTTLVSHDVGWLTGDRRHPGEHCFAALTSLVQTTTKVERKGKVTRETRYFIASAPLTPECAAEAIRHHWGIESMRRVLDVIFKEDQSRLRRDHGAHNMAPVRRLAFNMVRAGKGRRSIKTARKPLDGAPTPCWVSSARPVNLDSLPC